MTGICRIFSQILTGTFVFIFQSKRYSNLSKLEKFNKEKIPPCLKSLLSSTGYNTLFSISVLNADKIEEIEEFINKDRSLLASLNCCYAKYYQAQQKFEFIPGHKNVLLTLPSKVAEMKEAMKKDGKAKNNPVTNKEANITEEDAKLHLITKLQIYMNKLGFDLPKEDSISESNILEFARGTVNDDFVFKCKFSCLFCTKVVPLQYKTFWTSSNVTTHLKSHCEVDHTA